VREKTSSESNSPEIGYYLILFMNSPGILIGKRRARREVLRRLFPEDQSLT
jgi:hypothetical protein